MDLGGADQELDSSSQLPQPSQPSRARPKPSRQRDKPQLSCNPCRRRKSRCDRRQPCSCCSSRGEICTYVESPNLSLSSKVPRPHAVQDRLVQLERLVVSLMADSGNKAPMNPIPEVPALSPPNLVPSSDSTIEIKEEIPECGSMSISESEVSYVGRDHWAILLDGIADLKVHLDHEEQLRLSNTPPSHGSDEHGSPAAQPKSGYAILLYGDRRHVSREEILSKLPPKAVVDRHISRYFNYLDLIASSAIHGPSFLNEYETFWRDQSTVPIMWIGLLFSMICLGCLVSGKTPEQKAENFSRQIEVYREKIVQCLILGEYTRSGPYVLETVINYTYAEFYIRPDFDKDIWFLLALEVNLAMRMGCHRDPSHFPGISPYQGEMRRRLWVLILMADITVSSQMGMPRMISDAKWDTMEPRNLNDTDFNETTTELPPSRPLTERTSALGIIAMRRAMTALGAAVELTDGVKPCSYADVMRVDAALQQAVASIPPPLRPQPMAASLTDSPQMIMSRLFISNKIYQGQIALHRRFLHKRFSDEDENQAAYSHKTCFEACLGTLDIQRVVDEETCSGGQLSTMQLRANALMHHQFLTSTVILCTLLHHAHPVLRGSDIRETLQRCQSIWMKRSETSTDAKKAAETINFVLTRTPPDSQNYGTPSSQYVKEPGDGNSKANYAHMSNEESPVSELDVEMMLPANLGLFNPENFVMPNPFDNFPTQGPPVQGPPTQDFQQFRNFSADPNIMDRRNYEWMSMNWSET